MKNEIDLLGRSLIDSYVDLTSGDYADGDGFLVTEEDVDTVASLYNLIVRDYRSFLESEGYKNLDRGLYRRRGGDCYYVEWIEPDDEEEEVHTELIEIYAYLDGEMVLIPYSDDPVEAATYIEL